MAKETQLEPVQAVERALQALELISQEGGMGLNELHKRIKVNKASLLRTLYTLTENGYLEKDERSGEYTVTMKIYQLATSSLLTMDRVGIINNVLIELNRDTNRVALFSVEDRHQLLCLQSIGQWSSAYSRIGSRTPMYCTGAGKAILSAKTNDQILEDWEDFDAKPLTEFTITDSKAFLKEMDKIRKQGYAVDNQENEYRYFCLGAVVRGPGNVPMGALSITGDSLTPEEEAAYAPIIMEAAERLSGMLGYISQ